MHIHAHTVPTVRKEFDARIQRRFLADAAQHTHTHIHTHTYTYINIHKHAHTVPTVGKEFDARREMIYDEAVICMYVCMYVCMYAASRCC